MANTFELIEAVTVGSGGASDITFNTILPNWTDLCLKLSARTSFTGSTFDSMSVQFNGVTTSTYSMKRLQGNGASATSYGESTTSMNVYNSIPANSSTANTFGNFEIYIPNAFGANQKSVSFDTVSETNATTAYATLTAGLWTGTAAITSIKLFTGNTLVQYSTAYLYGVKNA